MPRSPSRRRRLPRFGLRTLFVLVAAFGCVVAPLALEWRRANQRRQAARALTAAGAELSCAQSQGVFGRWKWANSWLGEAATREVTHVNDPRDNLDDDHLKLLDWFPEIVVLEATGPGVTDRGLAHVRDHERLRALALERTSVTARGVATLRSAPQLQALYLGDTSQTDDGLRWLRSATRLKELGLSDTQITDAGLEHLSALSRLQSLSLSGTAVTDEGLARLRALPHLARLDLADTQVTDAGLARAELLPSLERLDVRNTRVTDGGASEFRTRRPDVELLGPGGERPLEWAPPDPLGLEASRVDAEARDSVSIPSVPR